LTQSLRSSANRAVAHTAATDSTTWIGAQQQTGIVPQPVPLAEGLPELGEQHDVEENGEPTEGERDRGQQRDQDRGLVEQG
jgi:hypothetical protein